MKKIKELTPAQEAAMKPFAQSWIDRLDKGASVDKPNAVRLIKALYKASKLQEPEVLIVNSPLGIQLAATLEKGKKANVRTNVRDQVMDHVRDVRVHVSASVRDNVWANVEANVRDVRVQVGDYVRVHVSASVWDYVGANVRDQVMDHVRDVRVRVGDLGWDHVMDQVRDQVRDHVGEHYRSFCVYGSFLQDAAWVSFYSFFEEHCGIKYNVDGWPDFRDLIKTNLCECLQLDGLCIGCEMPMYVRRDGQGRMHCVDGKAIEWADSYGLYSLWGVRFEPDLFKRLSKRTITAPEVFALENIEQRMASLRLLGPEIVCDAIDSKQVDKSERGNRLFSTKALGTSREEFFLRYFCPSTGREYVSFVPREIGEKKDADLAMAWKFGLDKSVYQAIELES